MLYTTYNLTLALLTGFMTDSYFLSIHESILANGLTEKAIIKSYAVAASIRINLIMMEQYMPCYLKCVVIFLCYD